MNAILAEWNHAPAPVALDAMLACCGSRRWAAGVLGSRPIIGEDHLIEVADAVWSQMSEPDWLEAFSCHPRIGERKPDNADSSASRWSRQEQSSTETTSAEVLAAIADGNLLYENQFGFTYIVCATGKSASEMLDILNHRLKNERALELQVAAEQQRQITRIRLGKWMAA